MKLFVFFLFLLQPLQLILQAVAYLVVFKPLIPLIPLIVVILLLTVGALVILQTHLVEVTLHGFILMGQALLQSILPSLLIVLAHILFLLLQQISAAQIQLVVLSKYISRLW